MEKRTKRNAVLALSAAALGVAALYSGVTVQHYTIYTSKLARRQRFRLALLTDLHSCIYGKGQHTLLRKILWRHPDAVVMAGDMYDDRNPPEGIIQLLAGLSGHVPMYFTPGNHEYRTGQVGRVFELFGHYGVTILRDKWIETSVGGLPVILAGADDCEKRLFWHEDYRRETAVHAFRNLPQDRFSILLAHRPEEITCFLPFGFDLVLNGHAHGGQVRIPMLVDGLFAPGQGVLPKYTGGIYHHPPTEQIVSRGLSKYWYLPRVCNAPEIVFIDIKGN